VIIIETAKKLFADKGYAATGLREIAETCGISLGNIYNHFKNKEEIFNETLNPARIIESLADIPSLLNEEITDHFDRLVFLMKRAVDKNIHLYRLIFIDLIEFGGVNTNRIVQSIIDFSIDAFTKQLGNSSLIGNRIRSLDFNFYIKAFVVAAISFFVTNNVLPSAKIENYSDEDMSKMISDVILNGILV